MIQVLIALVPALIPYVFAGAVLMLVIILAPSHWFK